MDDSQPNELGSTTISMSESRTHKLMVVRKSKLFICSFANKDENLVSTSRESLEQSLILGLVLRANRRFWVKVRIELQ